VKARRPVWIAGLIVMIILVDFYLFGRYVPVLAWHVQHGNHVEMKGLRFRVPLLYSENHVDRMNELSIDTFPGRLSRKLAFITIDFHQQHPPAPDSQEVEVRLKQLGMKKSAPHRLRLADREGTCVDYAPASGENSPTLPLGPYHITCIFGDELGAGFTGTQDAIADFYAIIQSAETVKGNH